MGAGDQLFDAGDQRIAGIDVDSGIGVGFTTL
jgi:hypothetical protein